MYNQYTDGKRVINITKRAYEVIYRSQGFIELKFIKDIEEAHEQAIKENVIKSLEKLKVEQLRDLAKEKGIEVHSKMKKEELIAALAGD
ncbi:Rho termination factor N-terminal domain-containing protein [Tissierella sp.]|uniref:Rho termination factor N-terminal domain-containing protein n=1 Tax=Tissierella sp. TaxID=41274 RepID=UPI0028AEF398|nr:Rho termination factor N-terminal domain-containing protein [Tissierella sp.]